jgi:hypothetical protein
MLRRSVGRSSGSPMLGVKRRERGGVRKLPSLAVASRRWLRSLPCLDPARCWSTKAIGAGGTKSAPDGAAKVRELPSLGKCVAGARILAWTTISLVSI